MELSLVLFTVLGQMAVGMTVMMVLREWKMSEVPGISSSLSGQWVLAGLVVLAALVASIFHLGHPEHSYRALVHLSTSWLSREILFYLLFGCLIVIGFFAIQKRSPSRGILIKVTGVVGLIAVVSSGMVYSPPSFPALNNGIPIFFFMLTAFILGSAFASYFVEEEKQSLLVYILISSLVVGLIVNLLIPSIWLSGGKVMQMTGKAYYGSVLYWLRLAGEFGLGLAVLGMMKKIPAWLPIILLAGELLGRIMVFSHVVNTSVNMGILY